MAKFKREHTWDVTIDGVQHEVYCRFEGNRYVLYADDDHVANIYRKSTHTMWQGMEEPVTICGKPCIFIVWDEKPDIVVDGRIVGRGISYEKALKKKNSGFLVGYRIFFWVGVLLVSVVAALALNRWGSIISWRDYIICGGTGIWMIIWSARNLTKLASGASDDESSEAEKHGPKA
jgi:hypothetical protein